MFEKTCDKMTERNILLSETPCPMYLFFLDPNLKKKKKGGGANRVYVTFGSSSLLFCNIERIWFTVV